MVKSDEEFVDLLPCDDVKGRTAAHRLRQQLELFAEYEYAKAASPGDRMHFEINRKDLHDASLATDLHGLEEPADNLLERWDVFPQHVLITRQKRSLSCAVRVRLGPRSRGIPAGGTSFGLPHWSMRRLIAAIPDSMIEFGVDLQAAHIQIVTGNRHKKQVRGVVGLTARPVDHDAVASFQFQTPKRVSELNPQALRRAFLFLRLVTPRKAYSPVLGVVQVENAMARGGNEAEVAVVEDPSLAGLRLYVAVEDVGLLCSVLSRMIAAKAELLETGSHWCLRDDVIQCFVEKPKVTYPNVDKLFQVTAEDSMTVVRHATADTIGAFLPLAVSFGRTRDTLIKLERTSQYPGQLRLAVEENDGRGWSFVSTLGTQDPGPSDWSGSVSLKSFYKILNHYDSFNVEITRAKRVLRVSFRDEQKFAAHAFLVFRSKE